MPITPGRVAWYVTGRFYTDLQGRLQDLGYFLHLEGIKGSLFKRGRIREASARLTFRSAPFQSTLITNGNVEIHLDKQGEFSIYFNPAGGGDFTDPDSFSRGTRIGVFQRTSVEISSGGFAIFSAELVDSVPFVLDRKPYDLRDLLPDGITQWGGMSADPLPPLKSFKHITAFTASAVAAG